MADETVTHDEAEEEPVDLGLEDDDPKLEPLDAPPVKDVDDGADAAAAPN